MATFVSGGDIAGYEVRDMNELVGQADRELYLEALSALNESGVAYMLGGAFAVYYYTNWWRDTHDIDVYVSPASVGEAAAALECVEFENLGEQAEGDEQWIYHAGKASIVVDVIWRFANLVEYITDEWFELAPSGKFLGLEVKFLPLEELVWAKSFVINRHRCDWPDIFRIIRAQCGDIDWDRLLDLVGEHWLLLAGMIDVFDWQHPSSVGCIPETIRDELAKRRRSYRASPPSEERECLLDPWLNQRNDGYAARRDE